MKAVYARVLRSMPLWLMGEYLEALGGRPLGEGQFAGQDWTARVIDLEDARIGKLHIGQIRLEVEAEPEVMETLTPRIEAKLMRGGG
jgi:hypothetical protein